MSGRPLAMVTGGARRVGLAIGRALVQAGCDLIVTYHRSAGDARQAAAELKALGADVTLEQVDLDDLESTDRMASKLAAEFQRLDVLVHNASVYRPARLAELTGEEILRDYRVNAAAPLLLSRRLGPLLAESRLPGGGAIVALTDMHALGRPRKNFASYAMSKAALIEMVRSLARDLAPRVRVNGVAPGVVAFPETGPEANTEMQRMYLSRVPLERGGTPEDAAEAVRWLALDARYVTGEILRVDGGRWLA